MIISLTNLVNYVKSKLGFYNNDIVNKQNEKLKLWCNRLFFLLTFYFSFIVYIPYYASKYYYKKTLNKPDKNKIKLKYLRLIQIIIVFFIILTIYISWICVISWYFSKWKNYVYKPIIYENKNALEFENEHFDFKNIIKEYF